jgi:Flp pilus assembly protein TadG
VGLLSRFWRDRHGNYVVITAVATIPLLFAAGYLVDFVHVVETKQQLANAADAAVLASLASDSPALDFLDQLNEPGPIPVGSEIAKNFFSSNATINGGVTLSKVDATVQTDLSTVVSTINYTAKVRTQFGGLLGREEWVVNGTVSASIDLATAVDFYLLLDNTPSMGLAATTSGIDKMIANTPDRCAFACHSLDSSDNYYNLAKALGVPMRIDTVRQATQQMFGTAKGVRAYGSQFKMALYTFGAAATARGLTTISALTSDLDKASKAAEVVDLMTIPYQNYDDDQQTDFEQTLKDLGKSIPKPTNGPNGKAREQVVFFVADGVNDSYKPSGCNKKLKGSGRCQQPLDIKECEQLKKRGIKIAVLYTTYLPLTGNSYYNSWIKPFAPEIATSMESCASPGLFFEVSPSEGIPEAMDTLFRKTIRVLRLVS